jgi:hypothetical protein
MTKIRSSPKKKSTAMQVTFNDGDNIFEIVCRCDRQELILQEVSQERKILLKIVRGKVLVSNLNREGLFLLGI